MGKRAFFSKSRFSGLLLPILTALLLMAVRTNSFAADDVSEPAKVEWVTLRTGYLTIYYKSGADLESMERSLKKRAIYFSVDMPSEDASPEDKIRYQLDVLFRRAQTILDMRPANLHVKIRIYRTRKEVGDEYAKIVGANETGDVRKEDIKSFYVNRYNTIYVSEEDISDSVIVHEMAHAIVDHYFSVIPPEKIRELLASYVDMHLAE